MDAIDASIADLRARNPYALRLAILGAFALRLEPHLLRALRRAFEPHSDPSAELDLWHSTLVSSRGANAALLDVEVLGRLRAALSLDPQRDAAYRKTLACLAGYPPLHLLEVELNALPVLDPGVDDAAIERRFTPILADLRQGGETGRRIARWLLQAAPRWHARVRDTAAAWAALLASSALLDGRRLIQDDPPRDLSAEDLARALPASLSATREVGVTLSDRSLQFLPAELAGGALVKAPVMSPALMVLDRGDGSQTELIDAEPGAEMLTGGADAVILRSLTGEAWRIERPGRKQEDPPTDDAARAADEQELRDLKSPPPYGTIYLSYARADDTGANTEDIVDRLEEEARKRGLVILRDKTTIDRGEMISEFMGKMAERDRVFILLSDKYLRSPYCMFELFKMWSNSRQNQAEFLRRVRVFTIDGTQIGSTSYWLEYAKYWMQQRDELKEKIDKIGWQDTGQETIKRYRLMESFAGNVSDILASFSDIVKPQSFEDFIKYGFDEQAATDSRGAPGRERAGAPLLQSQEQQQQAIEAAMSAAASAGPERLRAAIARLEDPSAGVRMHASRGAAMVSVSERGLLDFEADKSLKGYDTSNHIFADLFGPVRVRWPILFFLSEGNPQGAEVDTIGDAVSIISLGRPYTLMEVSAAIDSVLTRQYVRIVCPWFLRSLLREPGVTAAQVSRLKSLVALPEAVAEFLRRNRLRNSHTLLVHDDDLRRWLDPAAIAETLGFSTGEYAVLRSDASSTFQLEPADRPGSEPAPQELAARLSELKLEAVVGSTDANFGRWRELSKGCFASVATVVVLVKESESEKVAGFKGFEGFQPQRLDAGLLPEIEQ